MAIRVILNVAAMIVVTQHSSEQIGFLLFLHKMTGMVAKVKAISKKVGAWPCIHPPSKLPGCGVG